MTKRDEVLKQRLDKEVMARNSLHELSYERPDPLLVASKLNDEFAILLCALYGYGKASLIVQFLETLPFELINESEQRIKKELSSYYYRFQNSSDVIASFIAMRRLKQELSLNELFVKEYQKHHSILEALDSLIETIMDIYTHHSQGYKFLIGSRLKRDKMGAIKLSGNAPYKRWMMYLRWMIRKDSLDLGLWQGIDTKQLILPLDTHTFKVSQRLGLLKRKTYDLKAAVEVTNRLKTFDKNDPIKYDFALYRIGQENILP